MLHLQREAPMRLTRPTKNVLIKKYSNRRLYDTRDSRYITLVELAVMIRDGADVRVVDAKTSEDLTQSTLVQIILDGRGGAQMLPVDLLTQMVRMEEDALGEFLGRYMAYALDLYNQAKQGMQAFTPLTGFGANPLIQAANSMARMWGGPQPPSGPVAASPPEADEPDEPVVAAPQPRSADIDALRRQVEELRSTLATLADGAAPAPTPKKRNR
jgi:polyhydroxyalkanoate synthesis repressor PhaR